MAEVLVPFMVDEEVDVVVPVDVDGGGRGAFVRGGAIQALIAS